MKAVFTALALAAMTVPAVAAPTPATQSLAVQTGDLNLASTDGQKILTLRIHRAARTMCAGEAIENLPQTIRATRRCIADATSSAFAAARTERAARASLARRDQVARAVRNE